MSDFCKVIFLAFLMSSESSVLDERDACRSVSLVTRVGGQNLNYFAVFCCEFVVGNFLSQ